MGIFNQKPQGGNTEKMEMAYLSIAMKASEVRNAGVIVCKHPDGLVEIIEPGHLNFICFDEMAVIRNRDGDVYSNFFRFAKTKTEITVRVKGGNDFSGTYSQIKESKSYKDLGCEPALNVYGFLVEDWTPACLTISKSMFQDFFKVDLDEKNSILQINSFEEKEIQYQTPGGGKKKVKLHYPIFESAEFDFLETIKDMPQDVKAKVVALDKYITSRLKEDSREKLLFPEMSEPDHMEGGDEFDTDDYNDLPFDGDDKE